MEIQTNKKPPPMLLSRGWGKENLLCAINNYSKQYSTTFKAVLYFPFIFRLWFIRYKKN